MKPFTDFRARMQRRWLEHELDEARYCYCWAHLDGALEHLFRVWDYVVAEPVEGTLAYEEYINGKGQQTGEDDEQEEEQEDWFEFGYQEDLVSAQIGDEPDRDEDGYLIR